MNKINRHFGMPHSVVNLVKNEIKRNSCVNTRAVMVTVAVLLPDIDIDSHGGTIGIDDLMYHLRKD
tara:strand:+ start:1544 stop:1741 length:198 start_codon:yes stop_codon:yes gene_type:complete